MADTQYGVNHPNAVKAWSKRLMREALKETYASRFMGTTTNDLIYVKPEVSKQPGDRVRCILRMQLSGAGVQGDSTLEGNEEALTTHTDDVVINQLRHAVRSDGQMSEQRIPFSIREEARMGLSDWLADRIDTWFFNQICGNTGQADTKYTGNQATSAPTSATGNTRIIYGHAATAQDSEASLSTTDVFTITHIDKAIAQAKTSTPLIRPIRYKGGEYYVAFLHPWQVYNLRTTATANTVQWYDVQKARVQGGEMDSNGIFNGALGIYNGVVLHESTRIPVSPNKANIYRAVMCGAQAALMATGRTNNPENPNWYEELFDYGNKLGVKAGLIGGLKKTVYNGIDFGTIVISTYAAAP